MRENCLTLAYKNDELFTPSPIDQYFFNMISEIKYLYTTLSEDQKFIISRSATHFHDLILSMSNINNY